MMNSAPLKKTLRTGSALALLYVIAWVFGEHGHTYGLEPAKRDGTDWVCAEGEEGPFWTTAKIVCLYATFR